MKINDVIQFTENHKWCGCLGIITEDKGDEGGRMIGLRVMPHEEYIRNLREEILNDGLYKAVEKRCDQIDEECKYMPYVNHRFIQEQAVEILELLKQVIGENDE